VKTYYNEGIRVKPEERRREGGERKEEKGTASVPFLVEPLEP